MTIEEFIEEYNKKPSRYADIVTTEEKMFREYRERMIEEIEMKYHVYPGKYDISGRHHMFDDIESDVYARMQKDGLYDREWKFLPENKELVYIQAYGGHAYRDPENLLQEWEVYHDIDEDRTYVHNDLKGLEEDAELKKDYLRLLNEKTMKDPPNDPDIMAKVDKIMDLCIDESVSDECVYKISAGGYRKYSVDNFKADGYDVEKIPVDREQLKKHIKDGFYNTLPYMRHVCSVLYSLVNTNIPKFDRNNIKSHGHDRMLWYGWYNDPGKTLWDGQSEFDIEKNYVRTKEDLLKLMDTDFFNERILNLRKNPQNAYYEFSYQVTRNVYRICIRDYLQDAVSHLNKNIPVSERLDNIADHCTMSLDLDNAKCFCDMDMISDDAAEYDVYAEDYMNDMSDDEFLEYCSLIIPYKSDDPRVRYCFGPDAVKISLQDGTPYAVTRLAGKEAKDNVRNEIDRNIEKETGEPLDELLNWLKDGVNCYGRDDVDSVNVKEAIDEMKAYYSEEEKEE